MNEIILSSFPLESLKAAISEAVKAEVEKINFNNKPIQEPEYITRKETAKILGVSLVTLNQWQKQGLVPAYRIASRVRYKKAEVLKCLNQVQTSKYGRA